MTPEDIEEWYDSEKSVLFDKFVEEREIDKEKAEKKYLEKMGKLKKAYKKKMVRAIPLKSKK